MKTYCVKEKQFTDNVPGSEEYVKTKNNRTMLKAICASCGITKSKFVKKERGEGLADVLFPAVGSLLYNSGRMGLSKAVKSDAARSMMKNYAKKFIDQGIDNVTSDLSKKLKPKMGRGIDIPNAILKVAPKKDLLCRVIIIQDPATH